MPYRKDSSRKNGAGDYRHKLVFQRKTETRDSVGAVVETWVDDFTDWGSYEQIGAREFSEGGGIIFALAQKRYAETTARFEIRYRDGISADFHRIVFNDKIWNITEPSTKDGQRICLQIEASETR